MLAIINLLKISGWRNRVMGYKELIKKVQLYSGFSDEESKDSLDCLIETLAVRMNDNERFGFAKQLPEQLKNMALAVYPSEENTGKDILVQFMEFQNVKEKRARKEIISAWKALNETVSKGEIDHIKRLLPRRLLT